MAVDYKKEVDYVARLARLYLSEEEKEHMAGQMGQILEMANRIREVDTASVEPTAHVVSLSTSFREDVVKRSLPLLRVLQNAPRREKDFFRVPRITEEEEE